MKKVLSLVLAVIMLMGTFTVASFAYDLEKLPIFPEQKEGQICFAAENVAIPKGAGTYDVPVYLVSNYTPDASVGLSADATVELGFNAYISGNAANCATINSITVANEVQALSNYQTLDAVYIEEIPSDDYFHFNAFRAYYAFAAGLEALNQTKLKVATINVTISEDFAGGDAVAFLTLSPYTLGSVPMGFYPGDSTVVGAIYNAPLSEDALLYGEYRDPEVPLTEATDVYDATTGMSTIVGECVYSMGALYEKPAEPTWKDKLLLWARTTVYGIFARIESLNATISEYFRIIEGLLDNLVKDLPGGDVKPVVNPVETPAETPQV